MLVSVDPHRCSGHARCWAVAPEVFGVDDDGYSNIGLGKLVPAGLEQAARNGVSACPERALSIDDSEE